MRFNKCKCYDVYIKMFQDKAYVEKKIYIYNKIANRITLWTTWYYITIIIWHYSCRNHETVVWWSHHQLQVDGVYASLEKYASLCRDGCVGRKRVSGPVPSRRPVSRSSRLHTRLPINALYYFIHASYPV